MLVFHLSLVWGGTNLKPEFRDAPSSVTKHTTRELPKIKKALT